MYQNVVIYYNDSVDSDNLAAAMALMRAMETRPNTRLLWIVEPRQVSFGLSPTKEQQDKCEEVVKKHFPTRGNPWKILFGGLLSESDLNGIEELSTHDRELLQLAVKPSYGPKQDAILHRRLTAWDQVTCMAGWSKASVEILMDLESLDEIENPVNLNFHYKEELAARSVDELMSYQDIMNEPFAQRVESLRGWYRRCIERAETRPENHGSSVRPLDFNSLRDAIQTAGSVRFFGGASLTILQRFIQRGVASHVRCHLQVGSYDPSANLFPNQFNISLNPKAARFVFNHFAEFSEFAVVPSHAAQSTKYSLAGLKHEGGRCLERRVLGFNCREDPLKIAEKQVTIEKDYPNQACPMPDLTAFLCALIPKFNGATLGYAQVDDDNGALIFRREGSGIPMYDIMDNRTLKETEVVATLSSLAAGKDMPELVL
ncbi:uncharacterized protein G6M90_00g112120 [Metarhizium brunneum]|uniref:Uncharacterized protein n=1 Tax=Metarhizium brunneum TaxID=500148 RepID=A0A7D5ZAU8_9HYPO|nr:hypothetical protein G6M90_00g112120 [Metarhizium brunneum]